MRLTALLIICLVAFISCSKKIERNPSAEVSMKKGMEYFKKKKYSKAVKHFENSLMEADNPKIASKAQLFLADAYFLGKKYAEAIPAYKQFLDIYSETDDAKIAMMRLGLSHYALIDSVDRDMAAVEGSLDAFEKLRDRDPGFTREYKLTPKIVELRGMMADRELYVAKFYFRTKKPDSAEGRLKYLIKNYSDTKAYEDALYLYAGWLADKDRESEAVKYYTMLIKERPKTKYALEVAGELTKLLEKITEKMQKEGDK